MENDKNKNANELKDVQATEPETEKSSFQPDLKEEKKRQRRIKFIAVLASLFVTVLFLGFAALINQDFRTVLLSYFPKPTTAEEKVAKKFMGSDADELEEKNNNYIFAKREIVSLSLEESYEDISGQAVSVYAFSYHLLPKDASKMTNLEGRFKDSQGYITQETEEGNPHLIMSTEKKPSLLGVIYDSEIEAAGSLKSAVTTFFEEEAKSESVKTGDKYSTYINRDLGFSIEVPNEIWEKITDISPSDDIIEKEDSLAFTYSDNPADESSSFVLFWIERYEKSALRSKALLTREDNKDRVMLDETGTYFFCISNAKGELEDEKANEIYSSLKPYLEEISASFKILG
ncbi:MAG: hypothetical protein VB120_07695 [Lachnospiraceae bacterium]|nr:hypothetical protein [Lachnospiraceae bacterium]